MDVAFTFRIFDLDRFRHGFATPSAGESSG